MPNLILTREEMADVAAYILSLRDHRCAGLLPPSNPMLITDMTDLHVLEVNPQTTSSDAADQTSRLSLAREGDV
jgi:hypothetical protein